MALITQLSFTYMKTFISTLVNPNQPKFFWSYYTETEAIFHLSQFQYNSDPNFNTP